MPFQSDCHLSNLPVYVPFPPDFVPYRRSARFVAQALLIAVTTHDRKTRCPIIPESLRSKMSIDCKLKLMLVLLGWAIPNAACKSDREASEVQDLDAQ